MVKCMLNVIIEKIATGMWQSFHCIHDFSPSIQGMKPCEQLWNIFPSFDEFLIAPHYERAVTNVPLYSNIVVILIENSYAYSYNLKTN